MHDFQLYPYHVHAVQVLLSRAFFRNWLRPIVPSSARSKFSYWLYNPFYQRNLFFDKYSHDFSKRLSIRRINSSWYVRKTFSQVLTKCMDWEIKFGTWIIALQYIFPVWYESMYYIFENGIVLVIPLWHSFNWIKSFITVDWTWLNSVCIWEIILITNLSRKGGQLFSIIFIGY